MAKPTKPKKTYPNTRTTLQLSQRRPGFRRIKCKHQLGLGLAAQQIQEILDLHLILLERGRDELHALDETGLNELAQQLRHREMTFGASGANIWQLQQSHPVLSDAAAYALVDALQIWQGVNEGTFAEFLHNLDDYINFDLD